MSADRATRFSCIRLQANVANLISVHPVERGILSLHLEMRKGRLRKGKEFSKVICGGRGGHQDCYLSVACKPWAPPELSGQKLLRQGRPLQRDEREKARSPRRRQACATCACNLRVQPAASLFPPHGPLLRAGGLGAPGQALPSEGVQAKMIFFVTAHVYFWKCSGM